MDKSNYDEALAIVNNMISSANTLLTQLKKGNVIEFADTMKKRMAMQIRLLKYYSNPKRQAVKKANDADIFTMADTLNGLLKKFDVKSMTSFVEVCKGIKEELGS